MYSWAGSGMGDSSSPWEGSSRCGPPAARLRLLRATGLEANGPLWPHEADAVGLIVGVTLVAAGVILFVMLPVLRGDWATMGRSDDEVTEVDARKQAALRGLRDAEYDYRSGKIDQADYQSLKSDLARQALEAMQEEGVGGQAPEEGTPTDAVAKPTNSSAPALGDDRLEAEIARVRKGMAEGRTCAECGNLNVEKSRFCTSCGGPLDGVATTAGDPASG